MKIAFILEYFPVLSETFILNQITGLLDLGHEIKIYASINPKENKVHSDFEKYNLADKLYYFNNTKGLFSRLIEAIILLSENIFKYPIKIIQSRNVFKYGKTALLLKSFFILIPFLKERFDIIHCHFGPNGFLGMYLKEMGIHGKYITSFHGYDVNVYPQKWGKHVYLGLFKNLDLFTVNSNFLKNQLVKLGCIDNKIVVLPVGVRTERFRFYERTIKPKEKIRILTVGRLVEVKGHKYAIDAIKKLIDKKYDIEFLIAGDGPLINLLKDLCVKSSINQHVKFLGSVTHDEVITLYQNAHFFVLSSITDSEGAKESQGLVLQEAQATGLPVIATNCGGISEGLNEKAGLLVKEKNIEELANKLEYLINHPSVWPEMGRCGRKFVESYYDATKLNVRLVQYYRDIT